MNAVEIRGLSHSYRGKTALDNITLSLPQGASIGMIGPDGVGKSTLLALIAGVKTIQKGSVRVLGADPARRREREALLPRIAFMPQGLGKNLYPTLSVHDNVAFHARLFGLNRREREERIARLLDATGLTPFAERAAGKLSGGMKQKLSLCCALVHDPELLILDEPTTGVDPLSRRQFWQLVAELRAENPGMTVLVATAYMEEAEQFDYLLALDAGRVLACRPMAEVLSGGITLEAAYVAMLPAERRSPWHDEMLTPFAADPALPPAIEAEHLSKRFGDFIAVNDVSFRIAQGEIFGFLGSNGCGKSTTMKMLTGLLAASDGSARLLGKPVAAGNLETRMQTGYMSQAFSLYEELSVRQNLVLHARLYRIAQAAAAIDGVLRQFELAEHADSLPAALPLGVRQRLQLAAACLHRPKVLILDEPTSGVDPAARDMFWQYLLQLSRQERVTIFVSTHFMNEAERCDRISLMHRGRVLAVGTPAELVQRQQAASLEESFIRFLEQDEARESGQPESVETVAADKGQKQPENTETGTASNLSGSLKPSDGGRQPENAAEDVSGCLNGSQNADQKQPENLARAVEAVAEQRQPETPKPNTANNLSGSLKSAKGSKQPEKPRPRGLRYWLAMVLTFALREGRELAGDRIRLMFALLGPLIYLFAGSLGISYDTDQLDFAVLDQDQSRYSRELVREFEGSAYFRRAADLSRREDIAAELTATRVELVIEIPPHFGRDLLAQRRPQVAFYIDGAMPQQGENIAGYAQGIAAGYALSLYRTYGIQPAGADLDMRFIYNPTFKSINALAPGFLMLALVMIPAMMTALGVVREKEIGSIMNLYSSPASSLQYLLGKQLPYVALSMGAYVMLVAVIVLVLDVPVKGSLAALTAGALCFVLATTAFGLLVSAFVRSQVAAIFAAAILAMIPAMNFSGMIYPFSTLSGSGYWIGRGFPASWFQMVGLGVITKGLLWRDVYPIFGVLLAFFLGYLLLAALLLKKQES
ncbi:ATP-binding cassette domain-containing protein [Kingella sp. SNUBH-2017]|uniref:ATP-binding cassette domain-containing protein n=1 Tax=Kingella pumchi TaxID=2779506 RepID=A0ABS9NN23_9NEIS|nr:MULTISPECIES: ATP-binding cassette domain-containing protein [Kingella]MCG6504173.1 ATP-binding cassette domain-containing protein [Kingella pumchi]MDD2182252.1 ATP-binding cassette domain-containing protein [Kingella sp. SNUBH-2017]